MELVKAQTFISVSLHIFAESFHILGAVEKAMAQMGEAESGLIIWLNYACETPRLNTPDLDIASLQFYGLLKSMPFWPQIIGYDNYPQQAQYRELVDSSVSMFLKQYQV